MDSSQQHSSGLVLTIFGIMAGIILSFVLFGGMLQGWISQFSAQLEPTSTAQLWLISLFVIALLTFDVVLPVPSSLIAAFAATSLGLQWGAFSIWCGLTLGSCLGYWLGRYSDRWFASRWLKPGDYQKARTLSARIGVGALVCMRGVPVLAETSVIAAGLVGYPWRKLLLVTSLANLGLALLYAYIGTTAETEAPLLAIITASIAVPAIAWSIKFCWQKLQPQTLQTEANVSIPREISARFALSYDYPVRFTTEAFATNNTTLTDLICPEPAHKVVTSLVIMDAGVAQANSQLADNIQHYFQHFPQQLKLMGAPLIVEGGEAVKHSQHMQHLYQQMLALGIDRHSVVIAIGGGAVLDAVGYACATFHRGIKLLRMPSTVLAQNDAGVGVKNGYNALGSKNLIGTFSPPIAVVNDFALLQNLPARDKRAGLAEAVKVAAIRSQKFFQWLEQNALALSTFETQASHYAIAECARLHIRQITQAGDPFETGSARPLDYGHWAAHKLEALSHYQVRHGEAVAIGMALDALYAKQVGMLTTDQCNRLLTLLEQLGFALWHPCLALKNPQGQPVIFDGLEEFRQHLGGELCITLLSRLGVGEEVNVMDLSKLNEALQQLQQFAPEAKQQMTEECH